MRWTVGARVQDERDGQIRVGVVTVVDTHQVERTQYSYSYSGKNTTHMVTEIKSIDVKWDDGEEQKGLGEYDVHPEDSEVERSFRLASKDAQMRINAELAKADTALAAAVKISEETGVPFDSYVSPLGQSYIPNSLHDKFPDLDSSFYNDLTGAYGEYEGWQHSAVC